MISQNSLYLVPVPIGEKGETGTAIRSVISACPFFITEEIRTARRFIRSIDKEKNIDLCTFAEFNEHNCNKGTAEIEALFADFPVAVLMSEAGIPCVADPGWQVVRLAHKLNRRVIPLSGPSSVYMALMASGIQGQRFMFHGYIPVKREARLRYLRDMEQKIRTDMATQIFMETPYRNNALMEDLTNSCNPALMLSVSAGIESDLAFTATKSIGEWKKELPDLHKIPAVFVMGI